MQTGDKVKVRGTALTGTVIESKGIRHRVFGTKSKVLVVRVRLDAGYEQEYEVHELSKIQ